jgi:Flp pilus assembly protein TadD
VRLDVDDAAGHDSLARVLAQGYSLKGALAEEREAVRLDPHNPRFKAGLGWILMMSGNTDHALAREAAEIDPRDAVLQNNWEPHWLPRGRLDEAAARYREALKLDAKFAEARHNLGNFLERRADHDNAVAAYQEALSLKANDAEANYDLAKALAAQDNLKNALRAYQESVRLKPDLGLAWLGPGAPREQR